MMLKTATMLRYSCPLLSNRSIASSVTDGKSNAAGFTQKDAFCGNVGDGEEGEEGKNSGW